MTTDARFMRLALSLAARGLGSTAPNPSVGCVLASGGIIIGRGATQPGGRPHAETEALAQAGKRARGATAYVTLEPCAHTGQTGPCAQALIDAGVARVVSAIEDPDPRVAGRGHSMLRAAGIEVATGVCAAEAQSINQGFFKRIAAGKPFVTVKIASSLDGRVALANGASQWITGTEARAAGHWLRATHDAILTGIGTVLADDPALDCRLPGMAGRSPVRFVADSQCQNPTGAKVRANPPGGRLFVLTNGAAVTGQGFETISVSAAPAGGLNPDAMLSAIGQRGITRLLVEAGPRLTTAFVQQGLADQIVWFRSGKVLGGDAHAALGSIGLANLSAAPHFQLIASARWGEDVMETYAARS